MTWKAMCKREAAMIVTCAWCGKQILGDHDCSEKRAALAESEMNKTEGEGKE